MFFVSIAAPLFFRSVDRSYANMILLVILLGSVALTEPTEHIYAIPDARVNTRQSLIYVDKCWNATSVDLSGLGIVSFGPAAFTFCNNLTSLDLSGNWIKEIPEGFFSGMPKLENLSLAFNNLNGKALKGAFLGLANLKTLDLTHNPLSRILDNENFVGLSKSCEIHIGSSQHLRTITPRAFGRLRKLDNANQTSVGMSKNKENNVDESLCPDRLDDRIETFEVERSWLYFGKGHEDRRKLNDEPYSDNGVRMCKDSGLVSLVDFSNVTDTLSPNCSAILINVNKTKLKIYDDTITSFGTRWFRARNTSVNAIYLHLRAFENLTSDLLNDLPEDIRFFSLQESDLERLPKGVMVNDHLRGLDLCGNFIRSIEDHAFAGLKLTRLNLCYNPLVILDFVTTLPDTLLWLNLDFTGIREIPANTFSHLKGLLALSLSGNSITVLQPPGLNGLVSLQWLDLALANVEELRPGVFQDLSKLHSIDLSTNQITRLDKGVFGGLGCLTKMTLRWCRLKRISAGALDELTGHLEELDLGGNLLEVLETGSFVGAPKFTLSLETNYIRRIERNAFDLPYLKYLDLRHNNLTTIEKGAAKSLGNLADATEVRLGFNPIERLDNGVLAGLSSEAQVSLAMTPMKVLQAGVFDDA